MALTIVTRIPWSVLTACLAVCTALYVFMSISDIHTKMQKRIEMVRLECLSLVSSKLRQNTPDGNETCNNTNHVIVLKKGGGKSANVEDDSDSGEEYTDDHEDNEDDEVDNMIDIVGTIITSNLSPCIEDHSVNYTPQTSCVITDTDVGDVDADGTNSTDTGSATTFPQQTEIVPIEGDSESLRPNNLNEGKLKSMRVDELRRLLSSTNTPGVTATAIASMKKDAIISLIISTAL
eukprot:gene17910-24299_t